MKIFLVRVNSITRAASIPIGIGYVAEALRRSGHEVHVLDARVLRLSPPETCRRILSVSPDLVGISAMHYELGGVQDLLNALSGEKYSGSTILGGPISSTMGEQMVSEGLVDAAVVGEGERAVVSYLEALSGSGSMESIPGLIYKENGALGKNPTQLISDIDELVPAWDLINPEQYFRSRSRHTINVLPRSKRSLCIFTSRGCPYGCIFCHNVFGKRFRPRSPEAVLEEIEMLKRDYGVEEIEIADDVFNLDMDRAKKIARLIIERDLNLYISCSSGLRADLMDEELLDLLREAGTHRINYAIETASPRMQKVIKKNLDLDKAAKIIESTAARGIFTFGYFMMGFPTETEADLQMTIDYALASKLHGAAFFYLNPYPSTDIGKLYPLPGGFDPKQMKMDFTRFSGNLSEVPDETLIRMNRQAYRRFHFHPARMWRTAKVVPKNWNTVKSVAITAVLSLKDFPNFM